MGVHGWFTEGFDTADLMDAKALLDELSGLDHGVGHFRPLSITRQRHLVAYHGMARSHASLRQVFRQFLSPQLIVFPSLINAFLFQ
jgi:hypothetical protein